MKLPYVDKYGMENLYFALWVTWYDDNVSHFMWRIQPTVDAMSYEEVFEEVMNFVKMLVAGGHSINEIFTKEIRGEHRLSEAINKVFDRIGECCP